MSHLTSTLPAMQMRRPSGNNLAISASGLSARAVDPVLPLPLPILLGSRA